MDLEFTELPQKEKALLTFGEDDFTVRFEGGLVVNCGTNIFVCLRSLHCLAIELQCRDDKLCMTEVNDQLLSLEGLEVKAISFTPL